MMNRGLTDWLSGSGGTGETLSQLLHISGKPRQFRAVELLPALVLLESRGEHLLGPSGTLPTSN